MSQKTTFIVGILALQGGFAEHANMLRNLGHEPGLVRSVDDTAGISAFILPGGESTTLMMLLKKTGLDAWLMEASKNGLPIFGTCAGMIVLAKLGLIDVEVDRNAYGSQLSSFEVPLVFEGGGFPGVFIRAPKVTKVGPGITVLATEGVTPVLLKQKNILVASFHPELTKDARVHEFFIKSL